MRIDIHFAHKVLILTDSPVEIEGAYRMPSSKLSRANVLKIFETTNTVVVIDAMIEYYIESFKSEFKYVEAAGGLVENEKGETLMIYCYRHWDLPKGHIDEGETADVCAVREVAEETGVVASQILKPICNTFHTYNVYGVWELKCTHWFLMRGSSGETAPQQEEGIVAAEWLAPEKVCEVLRESYPTIRKVFASL